MKRTLIIILVCFSFFSVSAQISTDEQPISLMDPVIGLALTDQRVDIKTMPRLDMARIQVEDERDEQNGVPPRFGFPHQVNFDLENSGTWANMENGDRVWRLSIHCPGALSINLLYDQFWLPENAKLFIHTSDHKHTIGAFTSRNNKGSREELQGFATGLLYGETITLEYFLPKGVEEMGVISIAGVVHGYRYIRLPEFSTRDLGSSGSCQVNVNCPEGANWQQEKNAVALILVGGTRMCTGSLINTTCNDDRPLFLTADHCLDGGDAILNPNLTTWSFYWHYESPTCTNPVVEPPIYSTSGAVVVANNANTDFALLQLTEDPKDRIGVTPYYLGWDRSGTPGTGGVGIHHPRGDIKKIATYTITPPNSDCLDDFIAGNFYSNENFWRINWASTANGHSVTEGGSSGSPLINSSRRVVGQLLGSGFCPNPDCGNPAQDIGNYGKFSVSWTGGGAADIRRRLDHWLNPGGGTAPNTIDGKAATILLLAGPEVICSSETYSIFNSPTGATITWTASPSGVVSVSGSGSSVTVTRTGSANNHVTLSANVDVGCGSFTVGREILVGPPLAALLEVAGDFTTPVLEDAHFQSYYKGISLCRNTSGGITEVEWIVDPGGGPFNINVGSSRYCMLPWTTGAGAVVEFSTSGTKWMSIRAKNACGWSVGYADFSINVTTGFALKVYPNPASEYLIVSELPDILGATAKTGDLFEAVLLDQKGKVVVSTNSWEGSAKLDVRNVPDGNYFLHVTKDKSITKRQIIIKH